MKLLILTKLYNGILSVSRFCPPMNRLFYVPRGETLVNIVEKFLLPSLSHKKSRKKEELKLIEEKRKRAQASGESDLLRVSVVAARLTVDQFDPIVSLSLLGSQNKTKPLKQVSRPIWQEDFVFDLIGADKYYTDLKCLVHCNRTNTFLGEVIIPLFDVLYLANNVEENCNWFLLMRKRYEDKEVGGELLLKFTSKVPAHEKTPRSFMKSALHSPRSKNKSII